MATQKHNPFSEPFSEDDFGECETDHMVFRNGQWITQAQADREDNWTDADEAALEEHEERKRQRIAEQNEY